MYWLYQVSWDLPNGEINTSLPFQKELHLSNCNVVNTIIYELEIV